MAGKNKAVFGIYPNRTVVDSAVDALKTAGFKNTDISVLFPENTGAKGFAHEKNTKAPEGASTGAGTGALLGGGLGWRGGIGAPAIPGPGPLIAAGPMTKLAKKINAQANETAPRKNRMKPNRVERHQSEPHS
jgi:hypothetical protein